MAPGNLGFRDALGLARSLAIYYAVPLRARQLRRFYASFVKEGALAFDIGAHVGSRVRTWRSLGARVVAVEPQPIFARTLRALSGRGSARLVTSRTPGSGRRAGDRHRGLDVW